MHIRLLPLVSALVLSCPALAATPQPPSSSQTPQEAIGDRIIRLAGEGEESLNNRGMLLNNLKRQYQFQIAELTRDLRELAARLAIDGMGASGRIAVIEQEYADLVRRQFELRMSHLEAVEARQRLEKKLHDKIDVPEVIERVESDPGVIRYREKFDDVELDLAVLESGDAGDAGEATMLRKRRELMVQKLSDLRASLAQSHSVMMLRTLEDEIESIESKQQAVSQRLTEIQSDTAQLSSLMVGYLAKQGEMSAMRDLLRVVEDELTLISQGAAPLAARRRATTQPAQ